MHNWGGLDFSTFDIVLFVSGYALAYLHFKLIGRVQKLEGAMAFLMDAERDRHHRENMGYADYGVEGVSS
jgi:hypothetical protein